MAKKRYFKLGDQALSFTDQKSGLHMSGNNVGEVDSKMFKSSKTSSQALINGHIKEITESEAEKLKDENGQNEAEQSIKNQELLRSSREKKKLQKLQTLNSANVGQLEQDDDDDEDEEDQDDDDDDTMTKAELIDAIKASDQIDEEEKKGLNKKTKAELQTLWDSVG